MAKKDANPEIELEDDFKVNEEDDFEFEEKKEEEKEEKKEEKKEEEKEAEEKEAETEEQEKEEKEEKEKKETDTEEDIFSEEKSEEEKEPAFNLNSFAEELGLEITKETKIATKQDFVNAVKNYIDKNKQEPDLSKYTSEARKLIEHLNKGNVSLEKFFENPVITSMNQMLSMSPEEKVKNLRYQELLEDNKGDNDKAVEALTEEFEAMSKGEIKSMAEDIDRQAIMLRQNEIQKLIGDEEKKAVENSKSTIEAQKKEKDVLINYIKKQDSFFGIKLTDSGKEVIMKDIDTGKFDQILRESPEATKFFSYMATKYGKKIVERYNNAIKDENRKGYNQGLDKEFKATHKIPDNKKLNAGSGKKQEQQGIKKGFENWAGSEIFGDDN